MRSLPTAWVALMIVIGDACRAYADRAVVKVCIRSGPPSWQPGQQRYQSRPCSSLCSAGQAVAGPAGVLRAADRPQCDVHDRGAPPLEELSLPATSLGVGHVTMQIIFHKRGPLHIVVWPAFRAAVKPVAMASIKLSSLLFLHCMLMSSLMNFGLAAD